MIIFFDVARRLSRSLLGELSPG